MNETLTVSDEVKSSSSPSPSSSPPSSSPSSSSSSCNDNDAIKRLQLELSKKESDHMAVLDDVKEKTKAYLAKLKSDHSMQVSEKDDLISTLQVLLLLLLLLLLL